MQSFSSFGKLFQTDGARKKISVDHSRFSLVVIEDVFHVLRDIYHEKLRHVCSKTLPYSVLQGISPTLKYCPHPFLPSPPPPPPPNSKSF